MSEREPTGQQADALREALRQREEERSQKGAISRTQPTAAGPPDLADVFGGLFGLLLGKRGGGRRPSARANVPAAVARSDRYDAPMQRSKRYDAPQVGSDRYDAPMQRSERYDAPQAGSDRYDKPANSWRDRLQNRLDEAKVRLEKMRAGAAQRDAGATPAPAEAERLVEPAPSRAGTMRASALRAPVPVAEALAAVAPASAAPRRRSARLRNRLRNRSEIRELYVASVLLGPPLARRQRRQPR